MFLKAMIIFLYTEKNSDTNHCHLETDLINITYTKIS